MVDLKTIPNRKKTIRINEMNRRYANAVQRGYRFTTYQDVLGSKLYFIKVEREGTVIHSGWHKTYLLTLEHVLDKLDQHFLLLKGETHELGSNRKVYDSIGYPSIGESGCE